MPRVAVIVVAAGKGERFGGNEKKVFARVEGRPIFLRSVELFIHRPDVSQTILVIAPEDEEHVKEKFGANLGLLGVQRVTGGARRVDSVAAGLAAVRDEAELVAVHDAARPCVSDAMIDAVFAEAARTGAAILAAPLRGTIKRVSGAGIIDRTVDRQGLWEAQTPQVFRRDLLMQAFDRRGELEEEDVTDDARLVEGLGHPVAVVESDPTNLKITTRADVPLAAAIIRSRPKPLPKGPMNPFEEAQW